MRRKLIKVYLFFWFICIIIFFNIWANYFYFYYSEYSKFMSRLLQFGKTAKILPRKTFLFPGEPYSGISGQKMGSSTMRRYTPLNASAGNIRKNGSIANRVVGSMSYILLCKHCVIIAVLCHIVSMAALWCTRSCLVYYYLLYFRYKLFILKNIKRIFE